MGILGNTEYICDFCVVGGGLAGTIAALSAARRVLKVVLIQDRPMLGGNCSSEIRMWVRGAKGYWNKETGILAELEEENIYRNADLNATVWDSVLFGKVKENENITLLLNSSCIDAKCDNNRIVSVKAWQLTTYTYHTVKAKYFADCSGDSILAFLTGAEYRIGREGNSEFNENIGPKIADSKTMGLSLLVQARETDHYVEFIPPKWANVYETDDDIDIKGSDLKHSLIRDQNIGTDGCNLWWIELGGDTNAIENTEETRDELLKVAFGVWDHIKNKGDHGCDNWELEWIGFLPGKRESVRYIGEHILTQNDIEKGGVSEDVVAYGGWPMDDHDPKGFNANSRSEKSSVMHPAPSPYGIPYRCLYSKNIENLFFAGRNISATHAAMSSTRVMATCSLLGQAVGTAVSLCFENNLLPRELKDEYVEKLQKELMNDGVFLPNLKRPITNLTKGGKINLSLVDKEILFSGVERPRSEDAEKNKISLNKGETLEFSYSEEKYFNVLRIQFDLDYKRKSVSPNENIRTFAQKFHQGFDFKPVKVPNTIVKDFGVYADDIKIFETNNNYYSLVKIPINQNAKKITVKFNETWGYDKINLYGCDFI